MKRILSHLKEADDLLKRDGLPSQNVVFDLTVDIHQAKYYFMPTIQATINYEDYFNGAVNEWIYVWLRHFPTASIKLTMKNEEGIHETLVIEKPNLLVPQTIRVQLDDYEYEPFFDSDGNRYDLEIDPDFYSIGLDLILTNEGWYYSFGPDTYSHYGGQLTGPFLKKNYNDDYQERVDMLQNNTKLKELLQHFTNIDNNEHRTTIKRGE